MTDQQWLQLDDWFHDVERLLIDAAVQVEPGAFKARFAAMIANVVGNMSDEYWKEFVKVEPCGRAGCTCHLDVQFHATEIFKLLRKHHEAFAEVKSGSV